MGYFFKGNKVVLEGIIKMIEIDKQDMKKIIVLAISSFLFWSCNINAEKSTAHQESETQAVHQDDEDAAPIELNNGEKWLVNEEMKPFVLKNSELVNAYIRNNQTDYKALALQLKEQNNKLIKSCTMDGRSHEELHKWLLPHLELVKELENLPDENEAKEIVMKLQKSNEMYHKYFN